MQTPRTSVARRQDTAWSVYTSNETFILCLLPAVDWPPYLGLFLIRGVKTGKPSRERHNKLAITFCRHKGVRMAEYARVTT